MIRGIRCENTRRIVAKALASGWVFGGRTRSSHGRLIWPGPPEQTLYFGFTPSDRNAWKRLAVNIEAASGVVVWERVKHGSSSRRVPKPLPSDSGRVERDRARFAATADARARAEAEDARRREIEDLMRPGR